MSSYRKELSENSLLSSFVFVKLDRPSCVWTKLSFVVDGDSRKNEERRVGYRLLSTINLSAQEYYLTCSRIFLILSALCLYFQVYSSSMVINTIHLT